MATSSRVGASLIQCQRGGLPLVKTEVDGPRRTTGACLARLGSGYKRCISIVGKGLGGSAPQAALDPSTLDIGLGTFARGGAARSLGTKPQDPGTQIALAGLPGIEVWLL
jgi:hypothetical protein